MSKEQSYQLRQLWRMRFERMAALERDSMYFYSGILRKHKSFLEGTKAKGILELIMKDEAKHIQIAEELLRMVMEKSHGTRT